ncbi:phage capsid protein [Caballeronia sp. dw_19]|uniref:phage capsid protein n=1 Tax=Caballeronia sp. dw_19 TaxID=2719791 RepID=UPI001BD26222|nr:phage capsid protein [Caballeronia sp. dw_19]
MNDLITAAFVQQFADGFMMVAQQKDSRLQSTITDIGGVTGTSFTANNMGVTAAVQVLNRLGDTEWQDNPNDTRVVMMSDWDWATPIDKYDVPKLKANPQGPYTQNGVAALNRAKDAVIYNALLGNSLARASEATPYTTIALPNTQKIVDGGVGMTKAKLITTKKQFRKNEADEQNGEDLYMLYDSEMLEDILSDTTLTSADFMAVQMLQDGKLSGKWLGFNWIPYEALKTVGTVKTTVAYTKTSTQFGTGLNREIDIGPRRDKRNAIQIYIGESYGAGRVQENKVVTVDYQF